MDFLTNCKSVMDYFYEICKIPHGSGNTDAIANYCVNFAKELGLYVRKDEFNNVIIKKNASEDKKHSAPIIIQGHLDMVCAKTADSDFDFLKDGIECIKDGDFVKAKNTTLGADNAIAVAYALSLLADDKISHPPLEVILTSDEEIGLIGANNIDVFDIDAKMLINIDSEEEGIFTVSCAGGARADIKIPFDKEKCFGTMLVVNLTGLEGGHSGVEIHKGGKNANKVLGTILSGVCEICDVNLVSISGGDKDNAIPANAKAKIIVNSKDAKDAEDKILSLFNQIKKEASFDKNMNIAIEKEENAEESAISADKTKSIFDAIKNVKNGVLKMDENTEGLVKTSLNLGVLTTTENAVNLTFSLRSNDNGELDDLISDLKEFSNKFGADFDYGARYPAWEYVKNSYLRDVMVKTYSEIYASAPEITAIHAGLECGAFAGKIKGLDAVSIGPEMYDVHTVRERVSVSSVERVWEFLKAVLKNI